MKCAFSLIPQLDEGLLYGGVISISDYNEPSNRNLETLGAGHIMVRCW